MQLITLTSAGQLLGLTRRSLERFQERGLLDFQRVEGHVYVDMEQVMSAKLLTVGRAARLVGCCWRTAQRWIDEGCLAVDHPAYSGSKGRVSIHEIFLAKNQKKQGNAAKWQ